MRQKLPYLLIYFFILIFILQIAGLIVLFLLPQDIYAADFKPQVTVGSFQKDGSYASDGSTRLLANYIQEIYKYAIGLVGILATVTLMFGGISWILAGGSAERVGSAKAWITSALTGLVLALCSYIILNTVNPALISFKITTLSTPNEINNTVNSDATGCCQFDNYCRDNYSKNNCENPVDYNDSPGVWWGGNLIVCNKDIGECEAKKMDIKSCAGDLKAKAYQSSTTNLEQQCKNQCTDEKSVISPNSYWINYNGDPNGAYCCICINVCDGKSNYDSCGTNGICYQNICKPCEDKVGDYCSLDDCCYGLCCDKSLEWLSLSKCTYGTPTNGKYCK
ncbi:MAG: hypothetical protein MUC28_01815 [Planctomycetes bacterium]|jgi:hypothetical protein|nr:hypothetical protein [Planctomycetota bacterium]